MLNIWTAFQREKSKRKVKCLQIYNDRNIHYNVEVKKKTSQNNADSQAENDRVENNSINLLRLTARHGNKENVSRLINILSLARCVHLPAHGN